MKVIEFVENGGSHIHFTSTTENQCEACCCHVPTCSNEMFFCKCGAIMHRDWVGMDDEWSDVHAVVCDKCGFEEYNDEKYKEEFDVDKLHSGERKGK